MKPITSKIWNAIIDISPVQFGVYDLTKHQRIFSSGLAEKLLGYSFEELQEFSHDFYRELIVEDDFRILESSLNRLLESDVNVSTESIFRIKDKLGKIIWVRVVQKVLERDSHGQPIKLVSSSEDITELKELEQELEREVRKLNAIPSENIEELRIQLNAVTNIMDQFRDYHFSSELDRRLWNYMFHSVKKMNQVVDDLM
jgi:PAS domain S-box-containing protein